MLESQAILTIRYFLGQALRTDGGYIVLPGAGNGRMWLKPLSTPMAQAPKWIQPVPAAELVQPVAARPFTGETALRPTASRGMRGDQDGAQRRAGVNSQHASATASAAWSAAAILRSRPRSAALTAAAKAMPAYRDPWRGLETKVRRAVTEGMREPRTTPDQSGPGARRLDLVRRRPADAAELLVDETLPEIGLATIGGQYGAAKTFVGADLAAAIMVGGDFAGKTVERRGGVLWLAAEGENEIEMRIQAAVVAKGAGAEARQPFARQASACRARRQERARAAEGAREASRRPSRQDFSSSSR